MSDSPQRTVVITGVTRGLGRAMVAEFVALGHVVAGCGRDEARIAQLRLDYPGPHRFSTVDVGDDRDVSQWAAHVLKTVGVPDLLINNAAVMAAPAPLWEVSAKDFDQLARINVSGVANVIRHFVPPMAARQRGIIINLSSGWGREAEAGVAAYCGSKWAIEGMTKALAKELPKGMAAIPLNPGIIDTDMLRSAFGENAAHYESPIEWARRAVRRILGYSAKDNGRSLTIQQP